MKKTNTLLISILTIFLPLLLSSCNAETKNDTMHGLILALIIAGSIIMVVNIVFYIMFMFKMKDVITSGNKTNRIWLYIGLILLIFFLVGYILVGFLFNPAVLTSCILFFGSLFVSVMLYITSRLVVTAKETGVKLTQTLIDIVDARDPNLNGHSRHVKNITMLFYKYIPLYMKININPVSLEYASLMHDIGKLGVPESILNKPDKLTPEEYEAMKTHPKIAVKLLKSLKSFDSISDWILFHHERADGKGYYNVDPKVVPLAAKIIAIADTYSAITMRRSYKAPRSHEEAIEIIKEVSGTQLDKDLVDIFVNIPKEELVKCIPDTIKD